MPFLCPACRTPLPAPDAPAVDVVTCGGCAAEIDLARAGTGAGRPRFAPERDRTGDVVGPFRLGARLGSGGMGTVYRAAPLGGGGPDVAVKLLAPEIAADAAVVARFRREVAVLRALAHPAIVRVLGTAEDDGETSHDDSEEGDGDDDSVAGPWFAMELVDGEDLRRRLARGRLAPAEALAIFGPLLDALAYAHGRGVVHRDLKPANVLIGVAPAGPKLADFGVAAAAGLGLGLGLIAGAAGGSATRLTQTAAVIGTLPYMSPEQRTGAEVDHRSDLFSVGVMLYEAIAGRLPMGAFPPASSLSPLYPPRIDRLVDELLQPDPEHRPQSAADAARALRAALSPRFTARARAAAVVAATLAVVAGGGGALALRAASVRAARPPATARADAPTPVVPVPPSAPPAPDALAGLAKSRRFDVKPGKVGKRTRGAKTSKAVPDAGGKAPPGASPEDTPAPALPLVEKDAPLK